MMSGCQAMICSSEPWAMLPRPPRPSATLIPPTRSMISVLIEPRAGLQAFRTARQIDARRACRPARAPAPRRPWRRSSRHRPRARAALGRPRMSAASRSEPGCWRSGRRSARRGCRSALHPVGQRDVGRPIATEVEHQVGLGRDQALEATVSPRPVSRPSPAGRHRGRSGIPSRPATAGGSSRRTCRARENRPALRRAARRRRRAGCGRGGRGCAWPN